MDVWILLFDQADRRFIQRRSSHLDARGRTEPIENAFARPSVSAAGLNERRCFIPALVAGKPQEWQCYLRLAGRAAFFPGRAAGRFLAANCRAEALTEVGADVLAVGVFGFALDRGATTRTGAAGAL